MKKRTKIILCIVLGIIGFNIVMVPIFYLGVNFMNSLAIDLRETQALDYLCGDEEFCLEYGTPETVTEIHSYVLENRSESSLCEVQTEKQKLEVYVIWRYIESEAQMTACSYMNVEEYEREHESIRSFPNDNVWDVWFYRYSDKSIGG